MSRVREHTQTHDEMMQENVVGCITRRKEEEEEEEEMDTGDTIVIHHRI